jgi:hypothetical protein
MWTFPEVNVVWKPEDIIALVCQDGYMSPNDWRPITACAVCLAESAGYPLAVSKANWLPGTKSHLSVDVGLWQLNNYWQITVDPFPTVPKIAWADAFDPFKSWEHVWKLINVGRTGWNYNWSAWSSYNSGAYDKHVTTALNAMRLYRAKVGLPVAPFGVTA